MFTKDEVTVTLDEEMSQGNVITLVLETPDGPIELMGYVTDLNQKELRVQQVHIQGAGAPPVTSVKLQVMAEAVMEALHVDTVQIQGAARSSGANPGRTPRPFRFFRQLPVKGH